MSSNSMQSTTQTPMRFALLGSQRTSKTNIFSILSNGKSPVTYYPTNQNSTTLFQFLAKHKRSRALLDIYANLNDFEQFDLLEIDNDILPSSTIKARVNEQQIIYQKYTRELQEQENHHNHSNSTNNLQSMAYGDMPFSIEMKKKNSTTKSPGSGANYMRPGARSSSHNTGRPHHPAGSVLSQTLNYYNLDYINTNVFSDEDEEDSTTDLMSAPYSGGSFLSRRFGSNTNSFLGSPGSPHNLRFNLGMSPMPLASSSSSLSPTFSNGSIHSHTNINADPLLNPDYQPPLTTPILVELIDTPGTTTEELIPFLESSIDAKLAKDVLRNLADDIDVSGRQRVTPILNFSGLNDLNSNIDGYILCYSSIPDNGGDLAPPSYDFDNQSSNPPPGESNQRRGSLIDLKTSESLETIKMIRYTIVEGWREYHEFNEKWQNGKEYDVFSLNQSFKSLWKKQKSSKDSKNSSFANVKKTLIPPMIVVCTDIDHNLASPILIEEGRKLAKSWDCGFIQVSCEFENWTNVEEMMALMVRESIELKKLKLKSKAKKASK